MKRTTEDYLKTISLLEKQGDVHGVTIASTLGVSKPTVSLMIKRLIRDGYVVVEQDYSIHMTDEGRAVAESTLERNRTIRELLIKLGVDEEIAKRDACEMEHTISPESLKALINLAKLIPMNT